MSRHTPGPWRIFDCEFAIRVGVEGGGGNTVIVFGAKGDDSGVYGETTQQAKANAHLIASAPELLEALKALVNAPSKRSIHDIDLWVQAELAIAKAEGK